MADSKMVEEGSAAGFTDEEVSALVLHGKLPSSWDQDVSKITYGILDNIFSRFDRLGYPQSNIIEACAILCGKTDDTIREIIKKPSNLKRQAERALKKYPGKHFEVFSDLYCDDNANVFVVSESLLKVGITAEILLSICDGSFIFSFANKFILSNRLVLDLLEARVALNATWDNFKNWVMKLFFCEFEDVESSSLRTSVQLVKDKISFWKKDIKRYASLHDNFLEEKFIFPNQKKGEKQESRCDVLKDSLLKEDLEKKTELIEFLKNEILNFEVYVEHLIKKIDKEKVNKNYEIKQKEKIEKELKKQEKKVLKQQEEIKKAMEKVGYCAVRNVNKRINRVKNTVKDQEEIIVDLSTSLLESKDDLEIHQEQINEYESQIEELHKKLDKILNEKLKVQKSKSYYKIKGKKQVSGDDENLERSKTKILSERIHELENEKMEIEEKLDNFLNGHGIDFFKDGKYDNEIRMLYEDLLCMGISTNNIEKVVRQVLKGAVNVIPKRLPKATFAKQMLFEARSLAQIQVAQELLENWETETRTMHTDGTSKHGRSFITYDIVKNDGDCLITGLREVAGGDSRTQLNVLNDVLKDVCEMFGAKDGENESTSKILKSIKNVMSDRCAVQKKFNEIFKDYRSSLLPVVVEEWNNLSLKEREKLTEVNEFFCGMHYIVGLADQAEACCKIWDSLCWGNEKVGSLANGGYSKGESGVLRLIRSVCKAVQERGCEKSGRMVDFQTFLSQERDIPSVPLAPFIGNRFNILFYNAAGTYFLEEDLKIFFKRVVNENKLLTAVYHDLNVASFLAACRALGMISKVVTGPLWRAIVKDGHILDMNIYYQRLIECFSAWGEDSTEFMNENFEIFADDIEIHKDDIYNKLFEQRNEEYDEMTKQCLEIIFSGFCVVTKRLVHDHLKGGFLWGKESDESFRKETETVSKSNVTAERDFGMLDYQMKLKPKATVFAIEGLIMFKANKTSHWRNKLTKEKRDEFMEIARLSKNLQREKYLKLQDQLRNERSEKMARKVNEKERKEREQVYMKESLYEEIEKVGLWKSKDEIILKLKNINGVTKKKDAVYLQLRFRQKVIGNTHNSKLVFQLSNRGKAYSLDQMIENLISVINQSEKDKEEHSKIKNSNPSKPVMLDKESFLKEKCKLKEKVNIEAAKLSKRKKQSKPGGAKKRKIDESNKKKGLPVISCAEDFVGKRISQKFDIGNGKEAWFSGTVISVGQGRNPLFTIKYDDDEDSMYKYKLMEDYENDEVVLLDITEDDLIGAEILHLYTDDSGNDVWYKALVHDVDVDSDDFDNPDFFLTYSTIDETDDDNYYLCQLLEDYANGWVKLLS